MRFTSITHRGGAVINRDSFDKVCREGIYCFVMADGGGPGGETGAKIITDTVIKEFIKLPAVSEDTAKWCMNAAIEAFKNKIKDEPIFESMISTAAILITDGKKYICAHIGNTRIYVFRKGILEYITSDHTTAMEKYKSGEITFTEMRAIEDSKLIGIIDKESNPDAEISEIYKVKEHTAFLICSDGFWLNISEENMETALKNTKSSKVWLGDMLLMIEETANDDCGNISAAAVIM